MSARWHLRTKCSPLPPSADHMDCELFHSMIHPRSLGCTPPCQRGGLANRNRIAFERDGRREGGRERERASQQARQTLTVPRGALGGDA
eukprot:2596675-Rhodomonas_salina.1